MEEKFKKMQNDEKNIKNNAILMEKRFKMKMIEDDSMEQYHQRLQETRPIRNNLTNNSFKKATSNQYSPRNFSAAAKLEEDEEEILDKLQCLDSKLKSGYQKQQDHLSRIKLSSSLHSQAVAEKSSLKRMREVQSVSSFGEYGLPNIRDLECRERQGLNLKEYVTL